MSRSSHHHGPHRGARYTQHRAKDTMTDLMREMARREEFPMVDQDALFKRFREEYQKAEELER